MIRRFLAVLAVGAALAAAPASAALADYPPSGDSGTVSATTVTPGGSVTFAGDGFAFGSAVTISIDGSVYATVTASGASSVALGGHTAAQFQTAAYVRPAAAKAAKAGSFSLSVVLQKSGTNVLTGTGVDPDGAPRVVTAKVTVQADTATSTTTKSSTLPFTGSDVLVPGAIIGVSMVAGGFLLLSSVRSRKAGARG